MRPILDHGENSNDDDVSLKTSEATECKTVKQPLERKRGTNASVLQQRYSTLRYKFSVFVLGAQRIPIKATRPGAPSVRQMSGTRDHGLLADNQSRGLVNGLRTAVAQLENR